MKTYQEKVTEILCPYCKNQFTVHKKIVGLELKEISISKEQAKMLGIKKHKASGSGSY